MNTRLQAIIKYKTGGKQTAFAALMGWSPQYLSKLTRGVDFGLAPIITIVKQLPEINARWFLTGEGEMFNDEKLAQVRETAQSYILAILEMEKYLPVMSPAEVEDFEQMCLGAMKPNFSPTVVEGWQQKLLAREKELNAKFDEACKQATVKK